MDYSQKSETDETILRMRLALNVDSDLALSKKLGKNSRGYVANWRINNKVPASAVEDVSQLSGKTFEEIRYGREPTVNDSTWMTSIQKELFDAYALASDEIKEAALEMLKQSAEKSRQKEKIEVGGSNYAGTKSA